MTSRLRPIALVLAFATAAIGQAAAQTPDHRGEIVLDEPTYKGTRASAPIPPEMHVLNEGGSDGLGLCVIATAIINGIYQGVPGLDAPGRDERTGRMVPGKGSALWRAAKSRPGGYSPQKLERLLDELMPEEKWAEYIGTDPAVLDRLSRLGYAIGVTMNTGQLYNYQYIHHMVSLIHYRLDQYACIVDNNNPGKYHWMPAKEFNRRWIDQGIGVGWAHLWTRLQGQAAEVARSKSASGATMLLLASAFLFVVRRHTLRFGPAIAASLVVFALSAPQSATAQYVVYTQPQAPPAMAWYSAVINGQPTKVWGWLGIDGQVHYYPHMQPAKPKPKTKPARPNPDHPSRNAPEPKGLLNGVDIQALKERGPAEFYSNDPAFNANKLLAGKVSGKEPLPFEREPAGPDEISTEAKWIVSALVAVAVGLIIGWIADKNR